MTCDAFGTLSVVVVADNDDLKLDGFRLLVVTCTLPQRRGKMSDYHQTLHTFLWD